AGDDGQFAPPAEEEDLPPNAIADGRQAQDGESGRESKRVFQRRPQNQLRRAPELLREWIDFIRRKSKIDVAQSEPVQEKCQQHENKNSADQSEPADGQ